MYQAVRISLGRINEERNFIHYKHTCFTEQVYLLQQLKLTRKVEISMLYKFVYCFFVFTYGIAYYNEIQ